MLERMISMGKTLFQGPRRPSNRPPVQLRLESLEERRLLTAYTWHFRTPYVANWSIPGNWDDMPNHQATAYPGENGQTADTATFDGTSLADCTVDVSPTIAELTITGDYNSTVAISGGQLLKITSDLSSMAAGTVGGEGKFEIDGILVWTGGTISAYTQNVGTMVPSGANSKTFSGAYVADRGRISWQDSGSLILQNGSQIKASGDFSDESTGFLLDVGGGATAASLEMQQGGTFTGNPGLGKIATLSAFFETDAGSSTNVTSGVLIISAGSDLDGDMTINGGTSVQLKSTDPKVDKLDGIITSGDGILTFYGHVSIIQQSFIVNANTDDLDTMLDGPAPLNICDTYNWLQGVWSGSGDMVVTGTLNLENAPSGAFSLGRGMTNYGEINWVGNYDINVTNEANIENFMGGVFDIRVDKNILNGGSAGSFQNNSGAVLQKSAGNGTSRIDIIVFPDAGGQILEKTAGRIKWTPFILNLGAMVVSGANGGFDFAAGFEQDSGSTLLQANGDTMTVAGGNMVVTGGTMTADYGTTISVTGQYQESGGTTNLNYGNITVTDQIVLSGGTIVLGNAILAATNGMQITSSGVLEGIGQVNVSGSTLTNSGTVDPWTQIAVTGNYTQTTSGYLNEGIRTSNGYTTCDRLAVTGLATLDGTLNVTVGGGTPVPNQRYYLITYGSRSCAFAFVNLPSLMTGYWAEGYDDTNPAPNGFWVDVIIH